MAIVPTPTPPYYAAIFSSVRAVGDDESYGVMGERMAMLAMQQPGFIGFELGAETPERFSVFVSYWRTDTDIKNWKAIGEHLEAQHLGRERWYSTYKIRIARVERD